jgi:hypothetical protein
LTSLSVSMRLPSDLSHSSAERSDVTSLAIVAFQLMG